MSGTELLAFRRGGLALFVGVIVAVLGMSLLVAPVAANQVWAEHGNGDAGQTFTANEVVYVSGDLDRTSEDAAFPYSARVYVTRDLDHWNYGQGLLDLTGSTGSYNVVIGSSMGSAFFGEIVWLPMLTVGRYDIVLDENQNGIYDCDPETGVCDVVVGDPATSGDFAFQVLPPTGAPVVDKIEIKKHANIQAIAYEHLPNVINYTTAALGIWSTTASFAVAWSPMTGMIIGTGVFFAESNVKDLYTSYDSYTIGMGITLLKQIGGPLAAKYKALADDPPDTAFETVADLGAVPYHPAPAEDGFSRAQADTANTLEEQGALVVALTHSLEKLDGALAANDPVAIVRQARMVKTYADLLAANSEDSANQIGTLAGEVKNHGGDRVIRAADVIGYQQHVTSSGFSAGELDDLRAAGLTGAEIASFRQYITTMKTDGLADFNEYQVWLGLRDQTTGGIPTLRDISDQAQMVIDYYGYSVDDVYPVASAGGPYAGTEGTAVTLSAAASTDPNGDALSYAWDLDGDGVFDDGSSASVEKTWNGEFRGLVGVRVTDANGHADTAYAPVRIGSANRAPVMGATSPEDSVVATQPGDVVAFSAAATDPDGDAVTFRWTLAGAEVATGPAWTRMVTEADAGAFIDVVADDGNPFSTDPSARWRIVVGGTVSEGAVSVTSDPAGAHIMLDGVDTGRVTPAVLDGVSLGEHTVSVALDGYEVPEAKTVTVTATGTATADFMLDLLPPPPGPEVYRYIGQWGSQGAGEGQFNYPFGIAVDSQDNVYVADWSNYRIQKFTSDGDFILQFGSEGTGDGQFVSPWGIAVDPGTDSVYVTDHGFSTQTRVSKFTSTGEFVAKFGSYGPGDGQFFNPAGIAVDTSGNVYVVDKDDGRIQKFTSTGQFITKWGTRGHGAGEHWDPWGIAIDAAGHVYVDDGGNLKIAKYTTEGRLVGEWETPYGFGIAVDDAGNVYQTVHQQVRKYTPDGVLITQWGEYGGGNGQFVGIHGVAVASTGVVYTTEMDLGRVQMFALDTLPPTARFTMSASSGPAPLEVQFTDRSTGVPATWSWTFGDGDTSTDRNPLHTYRAAGTYDVTLTVTSAVGPSSTVTHTVTVTQGSQAPVVDAGADATAAEGGSVAFAGSYTDAGDAGTHTVAWDFGDGATASTLEAAHTYTDNGVYTASLTVTDAGGLSGSDTRTITVANANPAVDAGADQSATAGSTVSFTGTFTDAGTADTHTATWDWGDGSVVTPAAVTGGTVTRTHAYAAAGTFTATLTINDDDGGYGSDTVTVTVTQTNRPPVLDAIGAKSGDEQAPITFTATATDPDTGQALAFSLENAPAGATIDGASGAFAWTPTEAQDGAHTFTVRVSDGELLDTEIVTVTALEVNVAPVLAPIGPRTGAELALLTFTATATDADLPANTLVFCLVGAPAGAAITPAGVFTWTPTGDQDGAHTFTVAVSDGALSDSETITVTVTQENRAPELGTIGAKTVEEGTPLEFTISATDPDGDAMTYSATGVPAWATFNPATGTFSGTPGFGDAGTVRVTFAVSDGTLSDDEEVTITVNNANRAPSLDVIGAKTVSEDELLEFTIAATDPDGDAMTYSASDLPQGAAFNPATRSFTWTPTSTQAGTYHVLFTVSDGALSDDESVPITVSDPALDTMPPMIGAIVATPNPAPVTTPIGVTVPVTDPGAASSGVASVSYSIDEGPWVPMAAADGSFGGASEVATSTLPAFTSAGVYRVLVRATDGAGNTAESTDVLFLVVYDPNGGFVTGGGWITSPAGAYPADQTMTGKATFGFVSKYQKGKTLPTGQTQFEFNAADFGFHSTSYDWLVIAGAKAQFKGSGTVNGAGDYGFMLTATDGQVTGGGGTDKFRFKVWEKATGTIAYDNQLGAADGADPATVLGGGSIVVHKN